MNNDWSRVAAKLLGIASVLAISGCAGLPSGQELPKVGSAPTFAVTKYEPKTLDLPPTAYPIPNSSFVVFDQRKVGGITVIGALLGPLGIMLQSEAGKAATSNAIAGSPLELANLDTLTEQVLASNFQDPSHFRMISAGTTLKPAFTITASGWINLVNDKEAKVSILVETRFINATDTAIWRNQYIYHSSLLKPITGSGGWLEKDSTMLRDVSANGLKRAIAVFLKDVNQYRYADAKEVKLQNCLQGARKLTLLEMDKDVMVVKAQLKCPRNAG